MNTEHLDLLRHSDDVEQRPTVPPNASLSLDIGGFPQTPPPPNHHNDNKISDWEAGVSLAKAIMEQRSLLLVGTTGEGMDWAEAPRERADDDAHADEFAGDDLR